MKKFFAEFKKFITRGNIVDMAVGVIVGSSFTAIVNGLSNNILKPIINWLLNPFTIAVKELPTITPTAISTIFPRVMNFLNSAKNFFITSP